MKNRFLPDRYPLLTIPRWVIGYGILLITGIFLLNLLTPIQYDDYIYKFIFTETGFSHERVKSLGDLFISQYNHYFCFNGRSLIHFIDQLLLIPDNPILFNILNTGALFLLFTEIYFLCNLFHRKAYPPTLFLYTVFLCWFLIPEPTQTILWKTGSINYLWSSCMMLLFVIIHQYAFENRIRINRVSLTTLFLFGFIFGWGHESFSFAMGVGLCVFYLFHWKKLNISTLFLIGGFLIGSAFVVLSPGILSRSQKVSASLFENIRFMLKYIFIYFNGTASILLMIGSALALLFRRFRFIVFFKKHLLLYGMWIGTFFFNCIVGKAMLARGLMSMEILAISILSLALPYVLHGKLLAPRFSFLATFCSLLVLLNMSTAVYSYSLYNRQYAQFVEEVRSSTDGVFRSPFTFPYLNRRFTANTIETEKSFFVGNLLHYFNRPINFVVLDADIYDATHSTQPIDRSLNPLTKDQNLYGSTHSRSYLYVPTETEKDSVTLCFDFEYVRTPYFKILPDRLEKQVAGVVESRYRSIVRKEPVVEINGKKYVVGERDVENFRSFVRVKACREIE